MVFKCTMDCAHRRKKRRKAFTLDQEKRLNNSSKGILLCNGFSHQKGMVLQNDVDVGLDRFS